MRTITYIVIIIPCLLLNSSFQQNGNDTELIPYQEITIGCLNRWQGVYGENVIQNQSEYNELLKHRSPHPNCISYRLPEIDFSKHTLIGYVFSIGITPPPGKYSQQIIKKYNTYIIEINLNIEKTGLFPYHISKWFLIPKVEDDSTIIFNMTIGND